MGRVSTGGVATRVTVMVPPDPVEHDQALFGHNSRVRACAKPVASDVCFQSLQSLRPLTCCHDLMLPSVRLQTNLAHDAIRPAVGSRLPGSLQSTSDAYSTVERLMTFVFGDRWFPQLLLIFISIMFFLFFLCRPSLHTFFLMAAREFVRFMPGIARVTEEPSCLPICPWAQDGAGKPAPEVATQEIVATHSQGCLMLLVCLWLVNWTVGPGRCDLSKTE